MTYIYHNNSIYEQENNIVYWKISLQILLHIYLYIYIYEYIMLYRDVFQNMFYDRTEMIHCVWKKIYKHKIDLTFKNISISIFLNFITQIQFINCRYLPRIHIWYENLIMIFYTKPFNFYMRTVRIWYNHVWILFKINSTTFHRCEA